MTFQFSFPFVCLSFSRRGSHFPSFLKFFPLLVKTELEIVVAEYIVILIILQIVFEQLTQASSSKNARNC